VSGAVRSRWIALAILAGAVWMASPAAAFEAFDGRIQLHGFAATQLRTIANNFDGADGWDLTQWYNILNLELEADLAPKGIGPFELLQVYVRAEARYDCIWTRACSLFPSVNTYGDRAERLPLRVLDAHRPGLTGSLHNGDRRRYAELDREIEGLNNRDKSLQDYNASDDLVDPLPGPRDPLSYAQIPGLEIAFANSYGPGRIRVLNGSSLQITSKPRQFEQFGTFPTDDPGRVYYANELSDCLFAAIRRPGGENGQISNPLAPWNPGCQINAIGAQRDQPNPFREGEFLPVLNQAGVDQFVSVTGPTSIPSNVTPNPATGLVDDPLIFNWNPQQGGALFPMIPYGVGENPYRPAPELAVGAPNPDALQAQGLYYPSAGLRQAIQSGDLDSIDQNFSQDSLAWNRGASQEQTKELKEAYLDVEMFEGRLWLRLGKQNIVWGKTELFRTTDQFNPQDLALASLPNLEESRIALWSARGTWSFYDIGPLEDVRLELATNIDQYQPADLGRCGEPYSLEVACLASGYFFHGITGVGLAGQVKPPDPWQDTSGLEFGGRVEFRYSRFSFQLSDFYGYSDFPYTQRIFTYSRNVDPETGRPLKEGASGPCTTGNSSVEPACLGFAGPSSPSSPASEAVEFGPNGLPRRFIDTNGDGIPNQEVIPDPANPDSLFLYNMGTLRILPQQRAALLAAAPTNLTLFAQACALTIGVATEDARACGASALNSKTGPGLPISTNANGASALFAGSPGANAGGVLSGFIPVMLPIVQLNQDVNDAFIVLPDGQKSPIFTDGGPGAFGRAGEGLGSRLTPEQEALWGCGPFFSIDCDTDGVDLLNAEASVIVQSWPGFSGTTGFVDSYDVSAPGQPGTMGFKGGPVATRYTRGGLVMLPGSRGPNDPGWSAQVDGCVRPGDPDCDQAHPLIQPFSGEMFRNELAAASWNVMMLFAARSDPFDTANPQINEFDKANGYRTDGCSFLRPQMCKNVQNFLLSLGQGRNDVRAGGTSDFGRVDFAWQQGGELLLRYQKRNVLGFAMDFTEDKTKTSWGTEFTWIEGERFFNNDSPGDVSQADTLNLTISADRPTFINFLNPNRSFLFNSQWFIQYIDGYESNFTSNGPFNVLATFTIFTGYSQDRLLLFYTTVFDFMSSSGAFLPSLTYRFTENFSTSFGVNVFFGDSQFRDTHINTLRPAVQRTGDRAYEEHVENGLVPLATRDEIFLQLRYTF
jgi:Protein of unknown function (DUF1302)